jgi:PBSX family phage portal protein
MSKNKPKQGLANRAEHAPEQETRPLMFSFGEPTPMRDGRWFLDYLECPTIGKWYAPPLDLTSLARTLRAAVHHSSAIYLKRNMLLSLYKPHPWLSRDAFGRYALDFMVFGNGYLNRIDSRLRTTIRLESPLAKYTRRGVEEGAYFFLTPGHEDFEFPADSVFHLLEPDINQEIYGLPEYLSSLNSVFLNESATLFRRRYYENGSHAGFIFYMNDPAHDMKDVEALKEAFKNSKGPGNFRNLFLYAPKGKKDGLQLIPVSEVAAKDEFVAIKGVSRDDQLASHRVPPQLLGIVPSNTGGFGDVGKAAEVFVQNEILPLQSRLAAVNEWLGEEVVAFTAYQGVSTEPAK